MTDEAVLKMVERELKKQPDMSSSDLYEKVAKKHDSVKELSTRQFHARYPLRVKRKMAGPTKRKSRTRAARTRTAPKRRTPVRPRGSEQTRDVLLQFAQELVGMGGEPSFTDVLSRVDHYADKLGR